MPALRSPFDREILGLALPALGALAAEPLYLLTDTAIVGHLGVAQLAALAIAATVLSSAVGMCIFLTYGTTALVARLHGGGRDADAAGVAAQALWLALGTGLVLGLVLVGAAAPLADAVGTPGHTADLAARYLRLSAAGVPAALVALSGQGYLRGMGDLRRPLVIVVAANVVNVLLELLLVYGLHRGLDGSAVGTVLAQLGMGGVFGVLLLRAPARSRRPDAAVLRRLAVQGSALVVRTVALMGAFIACSAACARIGPATLAAHQVGEQLFQFLALVLDAVAIAGQVIVARRLGTGDVAGARAAARRMIELSVAVGLLLAVLLLALRGVLPHAFSDDARVLDRARAMWPLLALMQPVGAAVFALDGILIGAGDASFLAAAMAIATLGIAVPLAAVAAAAGWGIVGVWAALNGLMVARLALLGPRFAGERWVVTGA